MSESLTDRERGFERKYELDQELEFKIKARGDKLLAQWAADKLELAGPAAEAYVQAAVASGFERPGGLTAKILQDLKDSGHEASAADIARRLEVCRAAASQQLKGG